MLLLWQTRMYLRQSALQCNRHLLLGSTERGLLPMAPCLSWAGRPTATKRLYKPAVQGATCLVHRASADLDDKGRLHEPAMVAANGRARKHMGLRERGGLSRAWWCAICKAGFLCPVLWLQMCMLQRQIAIPCLPLQLELLSEWQPVTAQQSAESCSLGRSTAASLSTCLPLGNCSPQVESLQRGKFYST